MAGNSIPSVSKIWSWPNYQARIGIKIANSFSGDSGAVTHSSRDEAAIAKLLCASFAYLRN
ncbi:hypothetical protein C3731_05095 [Brucella oryzae]|uniref:Uncharacterized protein n=1 Tax=Brucella oryzae TaxID=335286 RepID=A0A2S7J2Y3_9HYPH|nr:hypothetical protein C3731_05095 [Brucella oryzae]